MRVIVVGAGIGGLALAQGLRRTGHEVHVLDRDRDVSATGGYRLHLDGHACAALRRLLPEQLYDAIRASSAGPEAFRQLAVTDHRLRPLLIAAQDDAEERLLIGRVPLRRLLTHDLGDAIRFGAELTHHRSDAGGTVTAHVADGTSVHGDLLVGADGVGSRVARALAGRATSAPVGLSGIAGRAPLGPRLRALLPDLLRAGPALALGPGGTGMFLSTHDTTAGPAPTDDAGVPPDLEEPALVWGLIALDRHYPDDIRGRGAEQLVDVAAGLLHRWSPQAQALVRLSDPGSTAHYRFHAADPAHDLTPWPAGSVTCLGDAVHAMPPTGGRAAATAIRDADHLVAQLATVRTGGSTLHQAVERFHAQMAGYALEAVRESLTPLRWIRAMASPAATRAAHATLPVAVTAAHAYRFVRGRGGTAARVPPGAF